MGVVIHARATLLSPTEEGMGNIRRSMAVRKLIV